MDSDTDFDALPSRELHDRAMRRALHHADIGFLWRLLRTVPAAEAASGATAESEADAVKLSALVSDALGSGDGPVGDALRPLYIDYLSQHPDA